MILDDVFEQKNEIAKAVSEELEKVSAHSPIRKLMIISRSRNEILDLT